MQDKALNAAASVGLQVALYLDWDCVGVVTKTNDKRCMIENRQDIEDTVGGKNGTRIICNKATIRFISGSAVCGY